MAKKAKIHITAEELRQYARAEITEYQLAHVKENEFFKLHDYTFEPYKMTIDDLEAALKNMKKWDLEDVSDWTDDAILIKTPIFQALQIQDIKDKSTYDKNGKYDLPVTDEDVFSWIADDMSGGDIDDLAVLLSERLWGEKASDTRDSLDDYLELIHDARDNRSKPESEWKYPDVLKKDYVEQIGEWIEEGRTLPIRQKQIYTSFQQQLADSGDIDALHTLIDGYMDGSELYQQDDSLAWKYYEKLMSLHIDVHYTERFGDMAFDGQTPEGKPDIARSIELYSLAEANGSLYAKGRLSDLYMHGQGVRKSDSTALALNREIYPESLRDFLNKPIRSQFPDSALRMGFIFKATTDSSAGVFATKYLALMYFLQASAGYRKLNIGRTADGAVTIKRINEEIANLMEECQFEPGTIKTHTSTCPTYLSTMFDLFPMNIHVEDIGDGRIKLIFSAAHRNKKDVDRQLMVTIPQIGYCNITEEVSIIAAHAKLRSRRTRDIIADEMDMESYGYGGAVFYSYGREVLKIESNEFTVALNPNGFFGTKRVGKK